MSGESAKPRILTAFAWGVHLYTALGAVLGLLAIHYAAQGAFRASFAAMAFTIAIDSSDGVLARLADVKRRAPDFDGPLLDNLVDYLTYVVAPVFLMIRAGIAPGPVGFAAGGLVMLASAYQFCRVNAKTPDHYFLGFPSYWNVVAFYLYCLELPTSANLAVLLLLSLMAVVPIKYIYPSRTKPLRALTVILGLVWASATTVMLVQLPHYSPILLYVSLCYAAYYVLASFVLHARSILARAG